MWASGGNISILPTTVATSTTTGALQVTGGISTQGNLYIGGSSGISIVATGNINLAGNILPFAANATYNIGSATNWFNNIYGTSSHALYADLAEKYLTDQTYEPGTVVVVGGEAEVTACTQHGQDNVIGAISTNPAYLMNGAASGQPVALKGRIPLRVWGPIRKGQRLSTSNQPGYAESTDGAYSFAIALETDLVAGPKVIEAIIL